MAGTTYSKFFWADWRSEPGLQMCSLAARGLWIEILTLMADTPDATLQFAGRAPTVPDIAELVRSRGQDVLPLLTELETNGVFSRDRDGTIFSRRMRKDLLKIRRSSDGGKKSAEIRRSYGKVIPTTSKGVSQVVASTTINQSPESINHQPQKAAAPTFEQTMGRAARLGEALGRDLTTHKNGPILIGDIRSLELEGFDFELDILPAIAQRCSAGTPYFSHLTFFRNNIAAFKEARIFADGLKTAQISAARARPVEEWQKLLDRFLRDGAWMSKPYTPDPVSEGCLCPKALLDAARVRWNEQGQHPREDFFNGGDPWVKNAVFEKPAPFWGDNVIAMPSRRA